MLQTGLRDILSSIVGRIAALGHALAAHDIALGRSHGSRAWAAWKQTWGFGHHQHVMPSVFAPYAVSRAAPAPHARWPNECAIGHACRIVAIHAFGRCACGHDRRVVSEQEPTERTDGYDWHHLFLFNRKLRFGGGAVFLDCDPRRRRPWRSTRGNSGNARSSCM